MSYVIYYEHKGDEVMRLIRGSEYQDFLRCRYRWAERWINHLVPNKPNDKLFFGTVFHKFVEEYYKSGEFKFAYDVAMKLFEDTDKSGMEQVVIDDLQDKLEHVLNNYFDQWGLQDDKMIVVATELHVAIPLDDRIAFEGTIDLVYEQDGQIWFMDHKTTKEIDKYEKNAMLDRQISRYWWALLQLANGIGMIERNGRWIPFKDTFTHQRLAGKEVAGFIYNIVLRDYPVAPKVLKNGSLSTDKRQKTTWKMYLEAMVEHGIISKDDVLDPYDLVVKDAIPDNYKEMCEHLAAQETDFGNRFFRRVPVYRSQHQVNDAMRDFYNTCNGLMDVYHAVVNEGQTQLIYRNITPDCAWDCPFYELCMAHMAGDDEQHIRETLYHVEDKVVVEGDVE